jgi:hypothetical protein
LNLKGRFKVEQKFIYNDTYNGPAGDMGLLIARFPPLISLRAGLFSANARINGFGSAPLIFLFSYRKKFGRHLS